MSFLDFVKFSIVLCFLLYACHLDLKTRIIPNRVWKYMLITTIPITTLQIYEVSNADRRIFLFAIFGILFILMLSYLLYRMNVYGGADAKALLCLAVLFPFYPEVGDFPAINNGFGIFAFSVLANSVIFAPFLMFGLLFRNMLKEGIEGFFKNPLYYIAGYRIPIEKIGFHNLFEFIDEKGELKRVRKAIEPNEELISRLKKAKIQKVWVTPALPFIIFITFGYVVAFLFGDVLFLLITLFL
ncbi:MAG: prepilin peptidase [Archaeoglobaceae archaeon]|nr:prepilin peptidase [Archaeoglobaceae archaeon]